MATKRKKRSPRRGLAGVDAGRATKLGSIVAAFAIAVLVNVLTVELGLLVVLFGRRFKAGWRSHAQRIMIGLSTAAIAELVRQGVWEMIVLKAVPHNQAEYEHIMGLGGKLVNANEVVYAAVLVWWIACLWMDEPGAAAGEATAEIPAAAGAEETAAETGDEPAE